MKYYVYVYRDNAGGGRRFILAEDADAALKRLRQYLNERHPFRRFQTHLEQVLPA